MSVALTGTRIKLSADPSISYDFVPIHYRKNAPHLLGTHKEAIRQTQLLEEVPVEHLVL